MRRQIAEADEARKVEGAATLTAYSRGSTKREASYEETFHVRNIGRAGARDVVLWIALRTPGVEPRDAPHLTGKYLLGSIAPNEPAIGATVAAAGPFQGGGVPREADVVASWIDENGSHAAAIGATQWLL